MLPNKKFLIIGLGSMGQRRVSNLIFNNIKKKQIFGFDKSSKQASSISEKLNIKTFSNFKKAYQEINPDALIISTPPNQHHSYFLQAARDHKHFFVETGTSIKGYNQLLPLLKKSNFIAAPSHTFHFYPAIIAIKKIVKQNKIGTPLHFFFHSGQYILNWQRPWQDYRKGWFAQKSTSAGREMFTFQLRWLNDIINTSPKSICGVIGKFSGLPISANDFHSATLTYPHKIVGNVIVDTLTRQPEVILQLSGTKGELEWNWQKFQIKLTTKKNCRIIPIKKTNQRQGYIATEEMYNDEIKEFLLCIKNKKPFFYSFTENLKLLQVLVALEKSTQTGKTILLK